MGFMTIFTGWAARGRALFSDNKGPWGSSSGTGGGSSGNGGGDEPPENKGPWGDQPRKRRGTPASSSPVTSLDDFLKRSRGRFGGSGGGGGSGSGLPIRPDRSLVGWAVLGVVAMWLLFTTFHSIAAAERGVVTRLGRYSHTLGPGVGFTLPSPIDRVTKIDVDENREIPLGSASEETLMLTGDQNIIDIAYIVRWKIRDPEQYLFELVEPGETIKQVAESSMRAVIANVTLQGAIGNQRGEIESRVAEEMQQTLDSYKAGVTIQGVSIRQADPPAAVNDAFKEVTAAQQDAQSYINNANAYALQLRQKAQGDATAFDKVYEQYKLAPQVTKRRMYYETMEQVLRKVDKTIVEAPGVNSYLPLNDKRTPAPVREPGQ
ncbi:FtsH protease activity modulator HflK [Sphingomonas rhizophila]|uniref:Protein HflK n=2 Tax=Sphingomonas rhizophila TaxID=2071607 RepID=A0A7G9S9H2_9SPHN|nr:FtsH protease activity modulator HflK [Sphingomonas rhizophila]